LHYAGKTPFGQIYKVLLKILFYFENLFLTILKDCLEFYKILGFGLSGFKAILQKIQRNPKIENRKEFKKEEEPNWATPEPNKAIAQQSTSPLFPFFFFFSPDRWDPPVRIGFYLQQESWEDTGSSRAARSSNSAETLPPSPRHRCL
jgi:hypothetical protein